MNELKLTAFLSLLNISAIVIQNGKLISGTTVVLREQKDTLDTNSCSLQQVENRLRQIETSQYAKKIYNT